jgi:hypothetical protein
VASEDPVHVPFYVPPKAPRTGPAGCHCQKPAVGRSVGRRTEGGARFGVTGTRQAPESPCGTGTVPRPGPPARRRGRFDSEADSELGEVRETRESEQPPRTARGRRAVVCAANCASRCGTGPMRESSGFVP